MGLFPVQQQELWRGLLLLSENNPSGLAGPNSAAKTPSGSASPDSAEENSRRTCQPKLSRRKTPQDLPAQTVPQEIPPRVFAMCPWERYMAGSEIP